MDEANTRPALTAQFPGLRARPVVHSEHRVHGELLEQAVADHFAGAAAAFFSGLEDQVDRAIEIAVLRKVLCGAEQHRRVPIVAAGMHLSVVAAGVGEGVEFLHRQRIHVCAKADRARTGA
ncbi:MAG: hypothetical protein NVS3B2_00940 [Ramlibacter sp.]